MEHLDGFEEPEGLLPTAVRVRVDPESTDRLHRVVTAIVLGSTPEQIADGLVCGFEPTVEAYLQVPLQLAEVADYVQVLLSVLPSQRDPESVAA